jgi:multiple sugar transport system substrate-binding protein
LRSSANPSGSSAIAASLKTIATEVEFKRQTPAAGAKSFMAAGQKALAR